MSTPRTLTTTALNRITLDRQLLLRRSELSPLAAVEHLAGLQAQSANAPYLGLAARLARFTVADLTALLYGRQAVRASVLRGTLHLVAAADYRWLRPLMQPVLARGRQASFGRVTAGVDLEELAAAGRELLAGRVLTRPQLGRLLAERWPGVPADALGWSAQSMLQLVHVPPQGTWGRGGATPFALADEWLGGPVEPACPEDGAGASGSVAAGPPVERLVHRYLAAFGPAAVMDVQAWSGLTRLREVVARMDLRVYRDENGREVFDLPDAPPPPDPDTPAPARFLPEFDNLMVAYADRTRIMTDEHRRRVCVGSMVAPTVLVDGTVHGTWKLTADRLVVQPFVPLTARAETELSQEADRLLTLTGARDLEFLPPA
ncbi:winged helix DNA-binding domain-containing protein [Planomonospora sp. ID67723]|uniref:winged helix DNA-binding domain-containing protein n=1 Tax=Planomonospora sp. ID67723 TaxID=2738134 RepID=UPI0018C3F595|nr:winged helix DNA-binding domain-containing protein [Planomonospora sp. ID67723]MBG0831902.1 winged helix DNA-binding domain-containing protein [Planomonospora sp. ID67723]